MRSRRLTRRQLLKGAAGEAGLLALGGAALSATSSSGHLRSLHAYASTSEGPGRQLVSRPNLHPPVMSVDAAFLPLASATGGAMAPG